MAWNKYDAQHREIHYGLNFFQDLAVAELNPRASITADEYQEFLLKTRSTQVAHCAVQSWRARRLGANRAFLPNMEKQNADAADWRGRIQYDDIANPERHSRYIVALHGEDFNVRAHDNRKVTAYARVESWHSSNKGLGRFLGRQFPMITELESLDGAVVGGAYTTDVAVVVSHALTESPSNAQAGVRVYERDEAAIEFFGELGFEPRGRNEVSGYAGAWTIDMVTAPDVTRVEVQHNLAERFPILQATSGA